MHRAPGAMTHSHVRPELLQLKICLIHLWLSSTPQAPGRGLHSSPLNLFKWIKRAAYLVKREMNEPILDSINSKMLYTFLQLYS